ncbi:PREDICTED: acetylcholine receptor subunit alpha-like 1 [Bactrocera latifrons]|uniref:Acetylcholine receptor subunit alpha-like 1 n=1 Tax=Bactrocera latifrons TaxID=174628 RepID=A0A0K8UNS8_BACLA|nr:PREDICTED: acetylcholine receptor subunit alpha-like 1 [Bactrocera latifrons]
MKCLKLTSWSALSSFYLLIFSIVITTESKFYSASVARQSLITDLFVNYNALVKPTGDGQRIDVHTNLVLEHFDFRESDGSVHFVGLLNVLWQDPKLGWNPRDYNNLTRIPVRQKLIWVPDLEVYNNAPDKFLRMHHHGTVILAHTGMVLWSDNVDMNVFCTTNMNNWPHDKHECKLNLGSWTYDGFELDFKNYTNPNDSMSFEDKYMASMKYKLTDFSVERVATVYSCCAEPYIVMEYHISFERRCAFVTVFRALGSTVILLSMLTLSFETSHYSKICLNGLNLIIITFVLLYFAQNVGKFARTTPYIAKFFSCSYILVTFQQLLTVFSIFATHASYRGKLHPAISNLLRHSFVSYITPKSKMRLAQPETCDLNAQFEDVTLQEFSNLISADDTPYEWMQLASFMESFTVIIFSIVYLILATVCFI